MQTKRNAFTFTLLLFLGGGTLSPIIDEATHPFFSSPTVPAWLKDILRVTHSFRRAHMWSGESPIEQVDWEVMKSGYSGAARVWKGCKRLLVSTMMISQREF